jgi:hypothetical protein
MTNKKAQIGQTVSWFIGFLVIIFILFLFIFMGTSKTTIDRVTQGKQEITLIQTTAYNQSEQQRQIFVLFENEYEDKTNYEITKKAIDSIEPKKILDPNKEGYKSMQEYLTDYISKEKDCFQLFIIDEELIKKSGGTGGWYFEPFYYFTFPSKSELDKIRRFEYEDGKTHNDKYSFFFSTKSFTLIKYFGVNCPQNENE